MTGLENWRHELRKFSRNLFWTPNIPKLFANCSSSTTEKRTTFADCVIRLNQPRANSVVRNFTILSPGLQWKVRSWEVFLSTKGRAQRHGWLSRDTHHVITGCICLAKFSEKVSPKRWHLCVQMLGMLSLCARARAHTHSDENIYSIKLAHFEYNNTVWEHCGCIFGILLNGKFWMYF